MIASLMMYAHPELEGAHARYWSLIRAELGLGGLESPATLSNDADEFDVWNAPDLVLSQTCGMPYRKWLHDKVSLIGTPDFGLSGCAPGYYNSAIIVRGTDMRGTIADFRDARLAYNQTFSQSGYAAPYALTTSQGFWFQNRVQSDGHVNSARMVASGDADIAAIDAVTWRLIQRYDSFADDLRVLAWTAPTPGLPYIAAGDADREATAAAVAGALERLATEDRVALGIKALIQIPMEDYLAIENPPEDAS